MKRLLVIGHVWPEPHSSAAGGRMLQLLDFFLSRNYIISFATAASGEPREILLNKRKVTTTRIEINDPAFDQLLHELQPHVVLFDRFMTEEQFGWRVSQLLPKALRILDTEDLHFLRKAREEAVKTGIPGEQLMFDSEMTKREIASMYRCDLSLIISEAEMDVLVDQFKISKNLLHYLPFLLDRVTEEEAKKLPGFEEKQDFMFIGNFLHKPNWDAVLNLKENVWPLIRKKMPEAQIQVYGAYPSEKVFNLHNPKTGFLIEGSAENAMEVIKKSRVMLAPIRFGAGLKGKFIDAMQCGTPAVTTAIGAEGIPGALPWNGHIEDEPEAFALAAVNLYQDNIIWQNARENGFKIINSRFSRTGFEESFGEKLQRIQDNLEVHRRKNFIGAMLQHHQHRSTYFMSKYIQLKNKKE